MLQYSDMLSLGLYGIWGVTLSMGVEAGVEVEVGRNEGGGQGGVIYEKHTRSKASSGAIRAYTSWVGMAKITKKSGRGQLIDE